MTAGQLRSDTTRESGGTARSFYALSNEIYSGAETR
ncbi:hypothetical protein CCHOA_08180 [Corynebacterium choanae]|uniref:Uncharacterized protein n=1 Tax=Corynebacterium choanae TaxID=1862358 RepID=A0A3G6J7J6_9CORY|nr:hypothetical protein CCHOA_08180 [Corynebacterium choanae]